MVYHSSNFSGFTQNAYYDGSYKYTTTGATTLFRQIDGNFQFLSAASGTADTAISFTQTFQINQDGTVQNIGKVGADPELRVMAAKTLLGKCVPDLKAVEITAQIEERKVLDISRLTDNDLTTIERVLEHAVIEGSPSGEDEEITEGVYQKLLASD